VVALPCLSLVQNKTYSSNRGINFDAQVAFPGARPELIIDENGQIESSELLGATISADQIVVDDLYNNAQYAGKASFNVSNAPGADAGWVTGNASFDFETGFESVTIENRSDRDLVINAIDVQSDPVQLQQNVVVNAQQQALTKNFGHSLGDTQLNISNTGIGDVILNGAIHNIAGDSSIHTANGDILSTGNNTLVSDAGQFNADQGSIGDGNRILLDTNSISAYASDDIALEETHGDMAVKVVTSQFGDVSLVADRSVIDADNDGLSGSANISGRDIQLTADTGSIGTVANSLEIDASGILTASTAADITLADVSGGLQLGSVLARSGDINISLPDTSLTGVNGENLLLGDSANVRALLGNVTLSAGDSITVTGTGLIEAAAVVFNVNSN
jgi:hypothetical protein